MSAEFQAIFGRLREILRKHAGSLKVTADVPSHFCLYLPFSPKLKKGFPVAWVKTGKAYVSYHFMPVYAIPALRDGMSNALKARMQGKSCFNFKVSDEALFAELEALTVEGFAAARNSGFSA
jgi:hypothetical protein